MLSSQLSAEEGKGVEMEVMRSEISKLQGALSQFTSSEHAQLAKRVETLESELAESRNDLVLMKQAATEERQKFQEELGNLKRYVSPTPRLSRRPLSPLSRPLPTPSGMPISLTLSHSLCLARRYPSYLFSHLPILVRYSCSIPLSVSISTSPSPLTLTLSPSLYSSPSLPSSPSSSPSPSLSLCVPLPLLSPSVFPPLSIPPYD